MKTWLDALGTCTADAGSVGGWPPPNSGASPNTPCPHMILLLASQHLARSLGPARRLSKRLRAV